MVGGGVVATLIPKEQSSETNFWIAGLLAGAGAAVFSFFSIHAIKVSEMEKTEQGK